MKIYTRGSSFAEIRIKQGLTQRQLAEKSGLSRGYVSLIEREIKTVGPAAALRLSEALGKSFEELFYVK